MIGGISMYAINLVDVADERTNYGILVCENEDITASVIQRKIFEVKEQMEQENIDWIIEDIIKMLPIDWKVKLQSRINKVMI